MGALVAQAIHVLIGDRGLCLSPKREAPRPVDVADERALGHRSDNRQMLLDRTVLTAAFLSGS